MIRFIYSALFYLIQPLIWVRLFIRGFKSKGYRQRIGERYGFCKNKVKPHGILVHSVSVGEAVAATPLIEALIELYPNLPITVTTMSVTGSNLVKSRFGDKVHHVYLPYDLSGSLNRFLNNVKPVMAIILETERWPNLIFALNKRKIPTIMANARLSSRSAQRYKKASQFVSKLLNKMDMIAAQEQADGDRFLELGLAPKKLSVIGSIKSDIQLTQEQIKKIAELKQYWQLNRPVWIAASTHKGEEEIIAQAHQQLLKQFPTLLLILVPRHPERFDSVAQLLTDSHFIFERYSKNIAPTEHTQVMLGDVMGELITLYGVSDMAFVGGSLVDVGGHNPLEPALQHLPIMMGKQVFNCADICEQLANHSGLFWVENSNEISQIITEWIEQPDKRRKVGESAYQILLNNQGALNKLLELIEYYLPLPIDKR